MTSSFTNSASLFQLYLSEKQEEYNTNDNSLENLNELIANTFVEYATVSINEEQDEITKEELTKEPVLLGVEEEMAIRELVLMFQLELMPA